MKKKIFLMLTMAAVLVCLFAFSVSAAEEVTLADGTKADFTTVFKVNSSNQVTGFNDGYTKDSVTDVIFPDEIEGIECNMLFNKAANLNTLTFAATDTFFISGDGIFSGCSVKTIAFDPDCVVEIRKGNFSDCTSLTKITFPKFKKLTGASFRGCSNMVATNELILAEGMTDIGGHAFNGCTSLTGTVYFPSTLVTIQEYSFQNTGFMYFDLSKCANLTAVGGGYGGPFTDNDSITTLDLSGCVNLKSLKGNFAANCDNLTKVILPPNLETIPYKAFAHCYKLQSIVLPSSVTYVADEAFHSARRDQTIKTFTVYIQSDVVFHETYPFRDSSAKIEFVLIGEGVTAESFKAANTYSAITNATLVDYLDPASPWTYETGTAITNHTIVENYCASLALTAEHANNINPCAICCTDCGLAVAQENPKHNEAVSITYENGYDSVGVKLTACTNKGCGHKKTEDAVALFVCLGYSAFENGNGSIVAGFNRNNTAIDEYTRVMGKNIEYGVFAAAYQKDGTKDVVNVDGSSADGAIAFDITEYNNDAFEIKIVGLATEEQKATKLALGAYIIVDNNEIFYLQGEAPNASEKYHYTTYNDVIASKA